MNFTNQILFVVFLLTALKTTSSQSQYNCISKKVLNVTNSIFTCGIHCIEDDLNKNDNKSKCIHIYGFPKIKVCGEVGLRYRLASSDNQRNVNSHFWLEYQSSKNLEIKHEYIEIGVKNGWKHWNNTICADFEYGVKLFTRTVTNMQLDRFVLFINAQDISNTRSVNLTSLINHCDDEDMKDSTICDQEVQFFGWMVTAIILIIVTLGSFILVISLSVTMPYNVWDKTKIQRMPVRATDDIMRI